MRSCYSVRGCGCLSVWLSVCSQHNSKTNDPKIFKLGIGNDLEISEKCSGLGFERSKVNRECHRVNKCIFTVMTITPMLMHI